ncbi:hypothetical protein PR048_032037, partial [Dryococelus australis]
MFRFLGILKYFTVRHAIISWYPTLVKAITNRYVGELFGATYLRPATVANAMKGFKACGFVPYKPQSFANEGFEPSDTAERDLQAEPFHDQPTISLSGQQAAEVANYLLIPHIVMQPGTTYLQVHPEVVPDEAENLVHISEHNNNENMPKPMTSRRQVSLNLSKPFPLANRPRATKQKRPNVSASILTSTPKDERNTKKAAMKLFQKSTKRQETTQPILSPGCEEDFVDPPMKT